MPVIPAPALAVPTLDAVHGTYPGDLSALANQVVGPNVFDELLVIGSAAYDPAEGVTHCTFHYLTQHDVLIHRGRIEFVDLVAHVGGAGLAEPRA